MLLLSSSSFALASVIITTFLIEEFEPPKLMTQIIIRKWNQHDSSVKPIDHVCSRAAVSPMGSARINRLLCGAKELLLLDKHNLTTTNC